MVLIYEENDEYEEENRAHLCKIRNLTEEITSLKEGRTPPTERDTEDHQQNRELNTRAVERPEEIITARSRHINATVLTVSSKRETFRLAVNKPRSWTNGIVFSDNPQSRTSH